jgi:hypothetical protein
MFARATTTKGQVTKQDAAPVVQSDHHALRQRGGIPASAEAAERVREGAVAELGASVASVETYEVVVALASRSQSRRKREASERSSAPGPFPLPWGRGEGLVIGLSPASPARGVLSDGRESEPQEPCTVQPTRPT